MSISKCPVCGSTNISDVACNNCGEMLLFIGDEKKDSKESNYEKKPSSSMEDIIKEILESSNVKTSPFEKIEYIDTEEGTKKDNPAYNNEQSASSEDDEKAETDVSKFDANKSFVDLAMEMGYTPSANTDETSDETPENTHDVTDAENEKEVTGEIIEEAVTEDFQPDNKITEEPSDVEVSLEAGEIIGEPSDVENSAETIEAVEETTDNGENNINSEETAEEKNPDEDRIALVEKISRAVNERIKKETETEAEQDDDIDILTPPQWTNSDKTIIKEKGKKKTQDVAEQADKNIMEIDTSYNKVLNISRVLLMILMLVTVICMFLPSTRIGGFSAGQDVQIFAIISVIPFAIGFALCIKEKFYIRKFIYSLLASIVFVAVYLVFMIAISGTSAKDIVYPLLCVAIAVVSVVGIIADKSSKVRKENTWFDAFAYILLFINMFVIIFVALAMVIVPDMLGGPDISLYLYELCAVMLVGVISAVMILKRVRFGADLLLLTSIALIIINIISYNKILSAVSFDYIVNIPYMHYVGYAVTAINILCTVFPIGMFFWMKHLMNVTPKQNLISDGE